MSTNKVISYNIRGDDSKLNGDLDNAKKKVEQFAKNVVENVAMDTAKNVTVSTAKAVGSGMLAMGTVAAEVGSAAVNIAIDMDQAMNQFIASTGKGKEETERYQDVLKEIYTDNYGESFEDIAGAMGEVTIQLGDMSDQQLSEVTESAFVLRDTFGYEIPDSAQAAKAMMENFGISGEEAMNYIAVGAQNGLDSSGRLLESVGGYSDQFSKLGFSADEMFQVFQKGAETGAFDVDKIGVAVSEFAARAADGSETTRAGFEALGLNADDMAAKFAAGGETAKEAFNETIEALASMEDPLEQNIAGTDLFGTAWQDLGPEAVAALSDIQEGAYATGDELNQLKEIKYDDLGSLFETLSRSLEMLLVPLGEVLIPILSELIESILPVIQEVLAPIMDGLGQLIESILPVLAQLFEQLLPPITEVINSVLPILLELMGVLVPIFQSFLEALGPIVECFVNMLEPIMQVIGEALTPLVQALTPIVSTIMELLLPAMETLKTIFSEVFGGIVENIKGYISDITTVFSSLIDFVKNVFTGDWKGAWDNIKNIFSTIANAIGTVFKTPINAMIDLINGFIKGLNSLKLPDWVAGGVGFDIPLLQRLNTGIDFVPGDFYPAYLDYGERVLTQQENARFNELGGLAGMETKLSGGNYGQGQKVVLEKGSIVVQTNIDGKEAAHTMAPYMDTELGNAKETGGRNR